MKPGWASNVSDSHFAEQPEPTLESSSTPIQPDADHRRLPQNAPLQDTSPKSQHLQPVGSSLVHPRNDTGCSKNSTQRTLRAGWSRISARTNESLRFKMEGRSCQCCHNKRGSPKGIEAAFDKEGLEIGSRRPRHTTRSEMPQKVEEVCRSCRGASVVPLDRLLLQSSR